MLSTSTRRRRTGATWAHRMSAAGLAVTALGLAACSGDDDASPTIPTPVTSDTMFVTTTSAPPASTPETTSRPASSTSSTSIAQPPSTTGPAPSSTSPSSVPLEQTRQAVADALVASWEAFDHAVRNPSDADAAAGLNDVMTTTEARFVFDTFLEFYIVNDLAERTSPDIPASIVPLADTLSVDLAAGTATMAFCFVSTNLLVQVQSDGSEEVQDDKVAVVLGIDTFVLDGGRWLDSGGDTTEVRDGETECPQ